MLQNTTTKIVTIIYFCPIKPHLEKRTDYKEIFINNEHIMVFHKLLPTLIKRNNDSEYL